MSSRRYRKSLWPKKSGSSQNFLSYMNHWTLNNEMEAFGAVSEPFLRKAEGTSKHGFGFHRKEYSPKMRVSTMHFRAALKQNAVFY